MTDMLIKNGRIIDPANGVDKIGAILVSDGKIAAIDADGEAGAEEVIDATGKIVGPGLIDMHVHFREPGDEEEETIASGATAALAGGFTTVACMPNTDPCVDNEAAVDFVYHQAAAAKKANVFPVGAISKGRRGEEMAEIGQMVRGGAVGFSDDGEGVANPSMMRRALQYASMFDKPILQHCEDKALSAGGCMNAGYMASILGVPGMNRLGEELMLYRDIQLAKQAKARYHAQHLSTAGAAEVVRQAKQQGVCVTAEVTPHHLLLTEECCQNYDSNYKMNPPLRTADDLAALREAVADGTVDALATDHAPHLSSESELEFLNAPFGIIGLECALGLYVKALIDTDTIDWPGLIRLMTVGPAGILGLEKGTLAVGADADITIIEPRTSYTVDVTTFRSKGRNCPYHNWRLSARATHTIVAGEIRYELNG